MAANVSESPGQPPGRTKEGCQSPSDPIRSKVHKDQKSTSYIVIGQEKHSKEKLLTPILCGPHKSKRRLDSSDGPDDGPCDPQLENLCRKKFKPIAPKPTVKKDHHQSVVTATVPIKEVSQSDFGSTFCTTKGDGKNGSIMFVSPKVQLVPSVPLLAASQHFNGDAFASNTSPYSMTVPMLPHGKYLNILNPPARVSMTDVAGHYKTVVQLLPNGSSNYCIQPSNLVSAGKASDNPSKAVPSRDESSSYKSGTSTTKPSKTRSLSKPKGSTCRYKYSLLMNGGSYAGNVLNSTMTQKSQPSEVPENEGVQLSLPAVLTSSGVLRISVPSVGIANGQVQLCDGLSPAMGMHPQSTDTPATTAQSIHMTGAASCTVAETTKTQTSTTHVVSSENDSSTHQESASQISTEKSINQTTNGLSLDETIRVMLRTPRSNASLDRQRQPKDPLQTKKTKPNRTAAKTHHKRHKVPTSVPLSSLGTVSANVTPQSGSRSGVNSTSNQVSDKIVPRLDQLPLPAGFASDQRNGGLTSVHPDVQYRPPEIAENGMMEDITPVEDVIVNQRSPGTILPNYVISGKVVNGIHPPPPSSQSTCPAPSGLSEQQDPQVSKSTSSNSLISISMDLQNTSTLTTARQSTHAVDAATSNNVQGALGTVSDQWRRTERIAPRSSSLPNFATGSRGFSAVTTTSSPVAFSALETTNNISHQRSQSNIQVPSSMSFERGAPVLAPELSSSSIMPSMHPQHHRQSLNIVVTSTSYVPVGDSITRTSESGVIPRTLTASTCSNVLVRNSHIHLQRNSSSLHRSHDALHPRSSVQIPQTLSEVIRPPGSSVTSLHQVIGHQEQNANSHTAVTYSHNALASSMHSAVHSYPVFSSTCNPTTPTLPTPAVPHCVYFPEVNRTSTAPVPAQRGGTSNREERGAVPARRQLHLIDDSPRTLHPGINSGLGHTGSSNETSTVLPRQSNQEHVVQRQGLDASAPSPNSIVAASMPNLRPEPNLFIPPMPVVPHHAGILHTAILRSRALERNPWRMPILNVSTTSSVSTAALPASTTAIPSTSAVFVGATQAAACMTSQDMNHMPPADNVIHLRPAPGMPSSLGRSRDKEISGWPAAVVGTTNRNDAGVLPGSQTAQLISERQGRVPLAGFAVAGNTELDPPIPVTSASMEQGQSLPVEVQVQSVPLHSNIPANARNAMSEALQRRTRNQHVQPQSSSASSSATSSTQQSHTNSVVASSISEGGSTTQNQPAILGANRQEIAATDSEQARSDLHSHQHHPHHMHAVPSSRLSSDSVSHLRMPLMGPPSVLYGSSTPVPNISMTPLHGVPLPGSLSAHSVQGHGMTHQLHATPPPAPHHGQPGGPACSPQRPMNHMFASIPYGSIHRSLYMPPPSPHPPDLTLMSPRSYGQVHVHDSVLYSPRFSSPIRNLPGSGLAEGMFGSTLPRSFSEDRLDTCCSVPYAHSPPIHDNSGHVFPPSFMSPSLSRNQPSLQTNLCNSLQRPLNHHGHPGMPERLPGPLFHESSRHSSSTMSTQLQATAMQTSSFASMPTATVVTVCSSLNSNIPVSAASTQPSLGSSSLISALSPASSTTAAMTPGSISSTSTCESTSAAATPTSTSSSSTTPVRVFNLGSTSDKYLPLELVVSSPSATVTTSASVTTLPAQLSSEQIVKFGDVMLECSRQILRESGRTVLCCWSCDYHTAEPKKMYRHQRRDEQPMKCQLCSHVGLSRCQLNQHFKEVHMDKDEDPFRASAVT